MRQRHKSKGPPEFSRTVRVDEIAGKRTEKVIKPSGDERAALSNRLGLQEIKALEGRIVLTPWKKNGVRAGVALTANITQTCDVSLEPVEESINERFNVPFLPKEAITTENDDDGLEPSDEDPPEPIFEGTIDLGELLVQLLAISINPYPRKPDACLEAVAEGAQTGDENLDPKGLDGQSDPDRGLFSSLQTLKNRLS